MLGCCFTISMNSPALLLWLTQAHLQEQVQSRAHQQVQRSHTGRT